MGYHILLAKTVADSNEILPKISEDEYLHGFTCDDIPTILIGLKIAHKRNGDAHPGSLTSYKTDPSRLQLLYNLKLNDNSTVTTTKEFVSAEDDQDLADIPTSTEDYIRLCQEIKPEDIQRLVSPKALSPIQEEWLQWHERTNHLPYSQMRKLAKAGVLPKKFTNLHSPPLCPSCAFGASKRRAWRIKDSYRSIKKDGHATPGSIVSIDQLASAQPGLIP